MKQHLTFHKSKKNYIYAFRLMEDAEIIEVLKSLPVSSEIKTYTQDELINFFVENMDEFEEAYTIIKEKGKWKCNCPWGLYRADEKPCWHVQEIPSIMLSVKGNEDGWDDIIEEAAVERRDTI